MDDKNWIIIQNEFEANKLNHFETVFTQGNGYLGTRGSFEEYYPGQQASTFVHGVFDDIPIVFTELANFPNWAELEIWLNGERFDMRTGKLLAFERKLDLRTGLLSRLVRWQSPNGHISQLHFQRFASRAKDSLCVLKVDILPENYSGTCEIHSGLNGETSNEQFKHWAWRDQSIDDFGISLELISQTSQVPVSLKQVLKTEGASFNKTQLNLRNHPIEVLHADLKQNETISLCKFVSIQADPFNEANLEKLSTQDLSKLSFEDAFEEHAQAWQEDWRIADIIIEGDDEAQLTVRFNIYHLLIAGPRHTERVNIGAKTLSGYGYRGHTFWDTEIFMLPFFSHLFPKIARNLLSYRYHNLPGARRKAVANGLKGAQYPWESASTGDEVTPTWVPHPFEPEKLLRIWTGDIEIHISSDIVWAILQYWKLSGDDAFMLNRGAQIILETSLFWESRLEWIEVKKQYELRNVIGPDEYHEHIDNNAYTNYFAAWHLKLACKLFHWLESQKTETASTLLSTLGVDEAKIKGWKSKAQQIALPKANADGVLEQFDGYFDLENVDLQDYDGRKQSMQAILGFEGVAKTQIIKQPDVLMLMYLLPELFDEEEHEANYRFYTPRTDYAFGSSLGPAIQSILAARHGDLHEAYQNFMLAAQADLKDLRGNASDGIHGASAGGLWQAAVFGFGGLQILDDSFRVVPKLPQHWTRLSFNLVWKGELHNFDIKAGENSQ